MKKWGVIPFYLGSSPGTPDIHLDYLGKTIDGLKASGIERIVVIDDGSNAIRTISNIDCDLIKHDKNSGKHSAVLSGIKHILDKDREARYVIQCDYDADQNAEDALLIIDDLEREQKNELAMVVGDRYQEAQPNPLEYRKVMLKLQGVLCKQLGYDLHDAVSGLRGYTIPLAKKFINNARTSGFGGDVEQLVIAYLEGAQVSSVPLTFSRRRSESTPGRKLMEVADAVLLHESELAQRGVGDVVNLMRDIKNNLQRQEEKFEIDLGHFGEQVKIRFASKEDGMYSAQIDESYRESRESTLHIK